MATNYDKPLLTLNQVKDMQAEKEEILKKIDDLQKKKALLDRKLTAAAEFMDIAETPESNQTVVLPLRGDGSALRPMTDAVVHLVSESNRPLSLKQLKTKLAAEGYPASRLGNYFYTVLRRLSDHNRIARKDGKVMPPVREPTLLESNGAPNRNG